MRHYLLCYLTGQLYTLQLLIFMSTLTTFVTLFIDNMTCHCG